MANLLNIYLKRNSNWHLIEDAIIEDFSITKEVDGFARIRYKPAGTIKFFNNNINGNKTYDYLYSIISDVQTDIKIDELKSDGTYETIIEGKLQLYGDWDYTRKTCELSVVIIDKYTELLKNTDVELNILDASITRNNFKISRDSTTLGQVSSYTTESSASTWRTSNQSHFPGNYAKYTDYATYHRPTADGTQCYTWRYVADELFPNYFVYGARTYYTSIFTSMSAIDYKASMFFIQPFGEKDEWNLWRTDVADPTKYVHVYKTQLSDIDGGTGWTYELIDNGISAYQYSSSSTQNILETIEDRGLLLYDVLTYFLSALDSSINITNVTGVNDYCKYFSTTDTELEYIMLAAKNDIINYSSTDLTQIELSSFSKLMEVFKFQFEIDWIINDSNYFQLIRAESITDIGLDLTNYNNINYSENLNHWKYNLEEINKEVWNFESSLNLNKTFSPNKNDFDGAPIIYPQSDVSEIKQYDLKNYNNNYSYLVSNSNEAETSGICFLATSKSGSIYTVINKAAILGSSWQNLINGKMALSYLMLGVNTPLSTEGLKVNRPYAAGTVNGIADTSLTQDYVKEYTAIDVPISLVEIDLAKLITTDAGNLRIKNASAKYDGIFNEIIPIDN